MKRIALMRDDVVRNVVVWDGVSPWDPGCVTIELDDGERCGPEWEHRPGQNPRFVAPAE